MVEIKDIVYLIIGLMLGLYAGVALYWLRLGQSVNEWNALTNLNLKSYKQGDAITVKAGTDLKPVNVALPPLTVVNNLSMHVWHDEGIGWHHTSSGWKRARIVHVYQAGDGITNVYKACHLDLL